MKTFIYTFLCLVCTSSCLAQENIAASTTAAEKQVTSKVLVVDMARKQDHAKIAVFLNRLETCQAGVLQIYYAFSHVKLSQNSATCDVLVEVTGELSETDKPDKLNCKINTLQKINWLQSDVPMAELQNSADCQPVAEAR